MVRRCQASGVGIVVDAVINHMAWRPDPIRSEAQGSAGSRYGRLTFPNFDPEDFHKCRNGDDLAIRNYQDRQEVQTCELAELPDLRTGDPRVQSVLGDYLGRLADRGVSGFRIDAAKHIPVSDLQNMLRQVANRTWVYSEVIGGLKEAVSNKEYLALGAVTDFAFSNVIGHEFQKGTLASLNAGRLPDRLSGLSGDSSVVFVDNHDNQRGHGPGGDVLTHKDPALYDLANVFMLTVGFGTPLVMSSYAFNDSSEGPPTHPDGRLVSPWEAGGCNSRWICEHRRTPIRNATRFRALVASDDDRTLRDWSDNGARLIAYGRGTTGFVVINAESSALRAKVRTSLPAGRYCNGFSQEWREGCEPNVVVTSSGQLEADVPALSVLLLHTRYAEIPQQGEQP